jgi:YHS domain-containing protein
MLRAILLLILIAFIARAFWRVLDGVLDGMRGGTATGGAHGTPIRGVQMARDPVCGTFVVPDQAITLASDGRTVHFCSARCRDAFLARPAHVQGRSA